MKKKLLECPVHGLTLFRRKRRCWGKKDSFSDEYTEKCFKCISEGRYKKEAKLAQKKKKYVKV